MTEPIYYLKEDDIIYRRQDGKPDLLPDQVLWPTGWVNFKADPTLYEKIDIIEKDKVREVAESLGIKTAGGKGSGHWGHKGRPGKRGGSAPGDDTFSFGGADKEKEIRDISAEIRKLNVAMDEGLTEEYRQSMQEPYSYEERKRVKAEINEAIAAHIEFNNPEFWEKWKQAYGSEADARYALQRQVRFAIKQWAETSGDNSPVAISMQLATADEFGLSDADTRHWPADTLEQARAFFDKELIPESRGSKLVRAVEESWSGISEYFQPSDPSKPLTDDDKRSILAFLLKTDLPQTKKLQKAAKSWSISPKSQEEALWSAFKMFEEGVKPVSGITNGEFYKAFVRAEYENTQTFLEKSGIDYVTVFRGVGKSGREIKHGYGSFVLQPASSFANHIQPTEIFGPARHVVRVPRRNVLATSRTGRGCLNEFEVLLLGGRVDGWTFSLTDTDYWARPGPRPSKYNAEAISDWVREFLRTNPPLPTNDDKIPPKGLESGENNLIYPDAEDYDWPKRTDDNIDLTDEEIGIFITEEAEARSLTKRLINGLIKILGGKGSGNFGHKGRPGKVGGSAPNPNQLLIPGTEDMWRDYDERWLEDASQEELNSLRENFEVHGSGQGEPAGYYDESGELLIEEYSGSDIYHLAGDDDGDLVIITTQYDPDDWGRDEIPTNLSSYDDDESFDRSNYDEEWLEENVGPDLEYETFEEMVEADKEALNWASMRVYYSEGTDPSEYIETAEYGDKFFTMDDRAELKIEVNSDIVEKMESVIDPATGEEVSDTVKRAMTRSVIDQWAQSSGDSNPKSIAQQIVIAEEFGLDFKGEHLPSDDIAKAREILNTKVPGTDVTHREMYAAVTRAEYKNTQDWFEDTGIEYVTVVRGVKGQRSGYKSGFGTYRFAPASSFTAHTPTTETFTGWKGYRMITRVPRRRVLSTAMTGRGCLSEFEVVLLGNYSPVWISEEGEYTSKIERLGFGAIEDKYRTVGGKSLAADDKAKTPEEFEKSLPQPVIFADEFIEDADWPKVTDDTLGGLGLEVDDDGNIIIPPKRKDLGGPGSGNFGHKGRPGKVGGSAPSDKPRQEVFEFVKERESSLAGREAALRKHLEKLGFRGTFKVEKMEKKKVAEGVFGAPDGQYNPMEDSITLNPKMLNDMDKAMFVVSHEFAHYKFNHVISNARQPGHSSGLLQFVRSNSRLLWGTDGITPYSNMHWAAFNKLLDRGLQDEAQAQFLLAVEETLAEMSGVRWGGKGYESTIELFSQVENNPSMPAYVWIELERQVNSYFDTLRARGLGGPGSGNFGHKGRPGKVGGSMPGGGKHKRKKVAKIEPPSTREKYGKAPSRPSGKPFDERIPYDYKLAREREEKVRALLDRLGFDVENKFEVENLGEWGANGVYYHNQNKIVMNEFFLGTSKYWDRVEWTAHHEFTHHVFFETRLAGDYYEGTWGLLDDPDFVRELEDSDGITEYSTSFWKEYRRSKRPSSYWGGFQSRKLQEKAINETLAELSSFIDRHSEQDAKDIIRYRPWLRLYTQMLEDFFG